MAFICSSAQLSSADTLHSPSVCDKWQGASGKWQAVSGKW